MRVLKLALFDWRNYENVVYEPIEAVNIVFGKNAQGKTNLLEAVYIASRAASFRQGQSKDIVRKGKQEGRLSLDFLSGGREQNIEIRMFADGRRKELMLNGVPVKKSGDLAGVFCTVLFAPEHLGLVRDGPEERRKFLDSAVSQLRPKYAAALADYSRVVSQRNNLLKRGGGDTLAVWDRRLLDLGSYIVMMRGSYVAKLKESATAHHRAISKGENLEIIYKSFVESEDTLCDINALKAEMEQKLFELKPRELEAGISLIGPHRDDLELLIDGATARIYGSQGQQRSIVLSLKFAECEIVEVQAGEPPVLLLDDVMSELDKTRQAYIRKNIGGRQVIITTVRRSKNGTSVKGGRLSPCIYT